MADIDEIATVKASLELLSQETDELLEYFKETIEKLDAIEKLPPGIKAAQFRNLEQSGAFKLKNVDIRHFSKQTKRPLTPPQFVQRTNRRLRNTATLIEEFLKQDDFEGGKELKTSLTELTSDILDQNDSKAVVDFKKKVDVLRESDLFKSYMDVKTTFVKGSPELKAEADFIATKETVEDGEMMAQARQEDIKELQENLDKGDISPKEAQKKLEELEESAPGAA